MDIFKETKRTYYFPSRGDAVTFKTGLSNCRLQGKARLRKTLATCRDGTGWITDTKHSDGFCVTLIPLGIMDGAEISTLAKSNNSLTAPHAH